MSENSKIKIERTFVKPFVYKEASVTSICIRMLVLVLIQVALLFFTKSYSALSVIFATFLGSLFAFMLRFFMSKEPIYFSFEVILQGLLLGMLLPETYPPMAAFIISFILLVVIKCIFSKGYNVWANTVALGVVIAWFIGRSFFPSFLLSSDLIGMRNPSLVLIQKGVFPINSLDSTITSFLNKTIFKFFRVAIPNGYVSFLWDSHSVIPAFRFNIVTILSSLFLFSDNGVDILVPAIFVSVYVVLVKLFAPFFYGGVFSSGDVILAVFTSGTLFCSLFLLQWFGTMPGSLFGRVVLAVLTGIIAFLIIGAGTSSVGMVYTILISNVATVLIKTFEDRKSLCVLKKMLSENNGVYSK